MNLSLLFKESLTLESSSYLDLIENAAAMLSDEKGRVDDFSVNGHLVTLEPSGEALVVGDLHGDLASLKIILQTSQSVQRLQRNNGVHLIFLGDYGDRGPNSAEVYYVLLKLKLAFPKQVIFLRGNHEGPKSLIAYPHDLPMQLQTRFPDEWNVVYEKIQKLFDWFYTAVYVEERYLMVHGGLSQKIGSLKDISEAQEDHNMELLEDLLWSDPDERVQEVEASPRGAGKLFSKTLTNTVLDTLKVKVLIRGHEACAKGFKINHEGKVLTLFSMKGTPYYNEFGAYLDLQLNQKPENALQLIEYIHQF